MGLAKVLLKAILIPIIVVLVLTAVAIIAYKHHRDKKKKRNENIEQQAFRPPPLVQWVPQDAVQKPVSAYPNTPGQMEQGLARV